VIPPFLLKTGDNPEGSTGSVRRDQDRGRHDRPAYFKTFLDNFYNVDVLGGTRISEQAWRTASSWRSAPRPTPRTPAWTPG